MGLVAAPGNTSIPIEELRDAARRAIGGDIPMSELAAGDGPTMSRSTTASNSRQAEHYRRGHVFLVGDAAHVHSGVGGPCLNLGMQDAINLGWKLAAEVRGWAPPELLDTYESERYPVGERVIMHSRAQTALLSPGPYITALRQLFDELLGEQHNVQHIADLMAGADIRYHMHAREPVHALTGTWMPDVALKREHGPTRVAELLRTARPILLDLAGRAEPREVAAGWADRVDVVAPTSINRSADAVLIRPDGYIAWASAPDSAQAVDGLEHALRTWFGQPTS